MKRKRLKKGFVLLMVLATFLSAMPIGNNWFVTEVKAEEQQDYAITKEDVGNDQLFEAVLESYGLDSTLTQVNYSTVANWGDFYISSESEITSLEGLDKLMPNLYGLRIETENVTDYENIPATVTDVTIWADVTLEDLSALEHLTGLQSLNLTVTDVKSLAGAEVFTDLTNLCVQKYNEYTSSTTNKVLSLTSLEPIKELTNLDELIISNTKIGDDAMEIISDLSGLQVLRLYDNAQITELPENMFANKTLQALTITGTKITEFPDISEQAGLTDLTLQRNSVSKEKVEDKIPTKFAEDEEWWKSNFSFDAMITTGSKVSDYYIPDQTLYAELKANSSDTDGILMLSEIYSWSFSVDYDADIQDFSGLATVVPDLERFYVHNSGLSEEAKASMFEELKKLDNLDYLDMGLASQNDMDEVAQLTTLSGLYIWEVNYDQSIDISGLKNLTELTRLEISGDNYTGIEAIKSLDKLESFYDYSNIVSVLDLSDTVRKNLKDLYISNASVEEMEAVETMTGLSSLQLNYYYNDDAVKAVLDLSSLVKLENLSIYAYMEEIILPNGAENLRDLSISSYSYNHDKTLAVIKNFTVANMPNLDYLDLYGVAVENLDVIQGMTGLYNLELNNTGLTSTAGIGNLTNLTYLRICNNEKLTTLDAGIKNLTNLHRLDLGCNALDSLPDLSALCTENGLLQVYYEDYAYGNNLTLEGNCLTEEDITNSGLTVEFTGDKNWMIEATSRTIVLEKYGPMDEYKVLYYPNLTAEYVYRQLVEGYYSTYYTNASEFVVPAELLQYILDEERALYITFIDENNPSIFQEYVVSSYYLEDWDGSTSVTLKKAAFTKTDSDAEVAKYFNKAPISIVNVTGYEASPYYGCTLAFSFSNELPAGTYRIFHGSVDTGCFVIDHSIVVTENSSYSYSTSIALTGGNKNFVLADETTFNYHNVAGKYCAFDYRNTPAKYKAYKPWSGSIGYQKAALDAGAYCVESYNGVSKEEACAVGDYFANGSTVKVYKVDSTTRTFIHVADEVVSYGCIKAYNNGNMVVSANDLSGVTWEDTSTPILTNGDADPVEPEDTTPEEPVEPEVPAAPEVVLPSIDGGEVTDEIGKNSAPSAVAEEAIVAVEEAVDTLIAAMEDTIKPVVEVFTKIYMPELTGDLFSAAKESNKDITIGVTNEDNQLMYSWTFDYASVDLDKVTAPLDITMSFATDKQAEIEEITGQNNGLYISIDGYHGELPGPATVKTYVGDKYENGDEVYLYYYNEEEDRVELVGDGALTVVEGYITYTLTHCSVYVVSETTPADLGIELPEDPEDPTPEPPTPEDPTPEVKPVTPTAPSVTPTAPSVTPNEIVGVVSPKTSDDTQIALYIGILVSVLGIAIAMKKRARA